MDNQSSVSRESIFITLVVGAILILATVMYVAPSFRRESTNIAPTKLSKETFQRMQNIQFIRPDSPLSQDNMTEPDAKYFNEKLYDEAQPTFSKQQNTVSSGRFSGTVTAIDLSKGLVFHITSTMSNSTGVELIYGYPQESLSKITVFGGPIENLKVGEEVYIEETNDYSKPYPDSIKSVAIQKVK